MKSNLLKVTCFVTVISLISGCLHSWKATPKNVPDYFHCNPLDSFPQMMKIPYFDNSWIMVNDCDFHRRETLAIAMMFFYGEWITKVGDPSGDVYYALNNLLIELNEEQIYVNGYSVIGMRLSSVSVSGLALNPNWIWVKTNKEKLLCETSLIHELVHVAIWAIKTTDGDPDHEGRKYSGWNSTQTLLIQELNKELCEIGI